MAFSTVAMAVAKVVMDAKMKVVEDLAAFLETKIEMDDDMKGFLAEFKSSLKESEEKVVKASGKKGKGSKGSDSSDSEKKKRAPSVFNLYVKDVMPVIKANNPEIKNGKQLIALAGDDWKNSDKAKFIKDKVVELKKEDKELDVVSLFEKAKQLFEGAEETAKDKEQDAEPVKKSAKKGGKKVAKEVEAADDE